MSRPHRFINCLPNENGSARVDRQIYSTLRDRVLSELDWAGIREGKISISEIKICSLRHDCSDAANAICNTYK